jgi:hypothetical protein
VGFFRTLEGRKGEERLRQLWRELAARMGEPAPAGLSHRRFDTPTHRLFVITLPEPERPTEAWMVCLAYAVRRSILGVKVGERRFFTLERGEDPQSHATVRFFCEWGGARERHLNHGAVDAAGIDGFVALVKARLAPPSAGAASPTGTAAASGLQNSSRR